MASYFKHGKGWTVSYRLEGQARQFIYGLKSEGVASAAAARQETLEDLSRAGLYTPPAHAEKHEAARRRPIADHVEAFERSIGDRGKRAQHAQQTAAHVTRLLRLAGIKRLAQFEAGEIQGAAKRLLDEHKLAPRTVNAAIKAARQFSTWLSTSNRTPTDVLHRRLQTYNEATDQRRLRRELSIEEYGQLLATTHAGPRRAGIKGPDRAMLYQVAVGTGFRQRACLSLSKASFFVEPTRVQPFVRLAAAFNKNGKARDQKIRKDLAAVLHGWLKAQPADQGPVWRTPKHAHLELMMRRDMEAARAAWLKEAEGDPRELERREASSFCCYRDHAGRYADFHGLRHTGISQVVRRAGLKVGQVWADHSSPILTAKYAHLDVADEERALEALPAARAPEPSESGERSGKIGKIRGSRKTG